MKSKKPSMLIWDDEFREIRGWEPSECAEILPDNLVPLQIRLGYNELAWENY